MSTNGLYYNNGEEQSCEIALSENSIFIYLNGDQKNLQIWNLKNTAANLIGDTLKLTKNKDPQQSISCSGALALAIHHTWANPKPEVKHKSTLSKNVLAFITAIVLVVIFICVLIYIYVLPWVAEKSVAFVSTDTEIQIGDKLAQVYEQEDKVNDSANFYANEFIKQLHIKSNYPLRLEVLKSPEINAFALPGGRIFIYSGLLEKLDSYKELTALLGHEITHVIYRHSLKSIFRTTASSLVIGSLFGNNAWVISKANDFKQLDYSRELETEADKNGVNIMVQNHVDPHGMLDLLHVLKTESAEEPSIMKYLSTHPDTDSRIEAVSENTQLKNNFPENKKLDAIFKQLKKHLSNK